MAKVEPWHSAISDVYHDNTACADGRNIDLENLRGGSGGRPLCEICARFDEDESQRDSLEIVDVAPTHGTED